jgi:hypothetical protein
MAGTSPAMTTRHHQGAELLLLNNDDVAKVLDMPLCLSALDGVFHEMAIGDAVGMGRIDVYLPSKETAAPYYPKAVTHRCNGFRDRDATLQFLGPNEKCHLLRVYSAASLDGDAGFFAQ